MIREEKVGLAVIAGAFMALMTPLAMEIWAATGPKRAPKRTVLIPRATVSLNVGDVVTVGGQQFKVSYSLIPDTSTPLPPPPPPPTTGWIDGYRNSRRDWTLAAQEGDLIFIAGGGFGAITGSVLLDSAIKAPVVAWSNTEVAITLPHVAAQAHVPRVDILSPAGALLASQSAGALTINPKSVAGVRGR